MSQRTKTMNCLLPLVVLVTCFLFPTNVHSFESKQTESEPNDQTLYNEEKSKKAFSSWNGKRSNDLPGAKRPAFSSWNGKRDSQLETLFGDPEKRPSFSAWNGKRDQVKRPSFSAWNGKRSQAFSSWNGKRAPPLEKRPSFSAWNGKRDSDVDKRPAFSSWNGKRTPELDTNDEKVAALWNEKRPAFRSWNGKRNSAVPRITKRAAFSAWGGKRGSDVESYDEENEQGILDTLEEKRAAFAPWSGKRNGNILEAVKRPAFSAWNGKRSSEDGEDLYDIDNEDSTWYLATVKRPAFSAWNGKRAFSAWSGKRSQDYHGGAIWRYLSDINDEQLTADKRVSSYDMARDMYYLRAYLTRLLKERALKRSFAAWKGKRNGEENPSN